MRRLLDYTPLKLKPHWDLMLKMIFRGNLLYFTSLILFMDELYLANDFRTRFLSFSYFYCCCYRCLVCVVVVVSGFAILLCHYFVVLLLLCIRLICDAMLDISLLSYSSILLFMFVTYVYHFMLLLISATLVLRSL